MFDNHFEVYLADTEESKKIHYSIRYQVYCEEMGFEKVEDFSERLEIDSDDAKSIHFIVKNKKTNDWVGAMRLIYKDDTLLPIEESCFLDEKINSNDLFDAVEISRLCIVKEARSGNPPQGKVDETVLNDESGKIKKIPTDHKTNRLIIWGLFHAASEYCYKHNINFCYFMTTSILAKVMSRGGLVLTGIGAPCEHRGQRYPFKIDAFKTYKSEMWASGFSSYQKYSKLKVLSAA